MKRLWPFVVALVLFAVLMLGVLFDSYGDRIPGAARMCESGLGVAGGASCQLAIATRDTVAKVPGAEKTFAITAYDPTTRTDLAFECGRGEVVTCESPTGEVVVIAP